MAERPVFCPIIEGDQLVREIPIEFKWHPGLAISQRQLNVRSLHDAAVAAGLSPVLEVSTKAKEPLGRALSAFNLAITLKTGKVVPVEVAFQASKVFERGGPFTDILEMSAREAKGDRRLRESGPLLEFRLDDCSWSLDPKTAFYDWIYSNALSIRSELIDQIKPYKGFTDIEFNPKKSINCQARSVALYIALDARGLVKNALESQAAFLSTLENYESLARIIPTQLILLP